MKVSRLDSYTKRNAVGVGIEVRKHGRMRVREDRYRKW